MRNAILWGVIIVLIPFFGRSQTLIGPVINSNFTQGYGLPDYFGNALALSENGDLLAVGDAAIRQSNTHITGEGGAQVFQWGQAGIWIPYGQLLPGDQRSDGFGYALDLSPDGQYLAVAAVGPQYDHNSSLWSMPYFKVYQYQSARWVQLGAKIRLPIDDDANERAGLAIKISADGQRVAVQTTLGVRVYDYSANDADWQAVTYLQAGGADQRNGLSLDMSHDGATIAVGNPSINNVNGIQSGGVLVFRENSNGLWTAIGRIEGFTLREDFGSALALARNGNRIVVSAPSLDLGTHRGQIRVFDYVANRWNLVGNALSAPNLRSNWDDGFGRDLDVSEDGRFIIAGAGWLSNFPEQSYGAVELFQYVGGQWSPVGNTLYGESSARGFGSTVAISGNGNVVALGAAFGGVGKVLVYDYTLVATEQLTVEDQNAWRLYPNPTSGPVYLDQQSARKGQLRIYDSTGNKVQSFAVCPPEQLDLSGLPAGMYSVELITGQQRTVRRILKV
jgi:hypothetical protein